MKHIGITGGSGFVGRHLTSRLISQGHRVTIFTRSVKKKAKDGIQYSTWDPEEGRCDLTGLQDIDAIVNLAGAGVADRPWTKKRRQQILDSRIDSTRCITNQLKKYTPNCKTFISASATGYYGPDVPGKSFFTEEDPAVADFLGDVCKKWEAAAHEADAYDRTVIIRFGIVLGKNAGAYKAFALPQSMGITPILGTGKQTVSWIHIEDLVSMICFSLENDAICGTYNGVSPNPVSHRELMKTIATVKGGVKIFIRVPAFLIKLGMGGMSQEILKSCTVSSAKIEQSGFTFEFPKIEEAVASLEHKVNN